MGLFFFPLQTCKSEPGRICRKGGLFLPEFRRVFLKLPCFRPRGGGGWGGWGICVTWKEESGGPFWPRASCAPGDPLPPPGRGIWGIPHFPAVGGDAEGSGWDPVLGPGEWRRWGGGGKEAAAASPRPYATGSSAEKPKEPVGAQAERGAAGSSQGGSWHRSRPHCRPRRLPSKAQGSPTKPNKAQESPTKPNEAQQSPTKPNETQQSPRKPKKGQ